MPTTYSPTTLFSLIFKKKYDLYKGVTNDNALIGFNNNPGLAPRAICAVAARASAGSRFAIAFDA